MKRRAALVMLVAVALMMSGCYHFHHSAGLSQKNVAMSPVNGKSNGKRNAVPKAFKVEKKWVPMWVWGLKGKDIPVDDWIAKEIGPNKEVTNVSIDTKASFLNGLLHTVTLGIYCPQTVTIAGEYK